MLNREQILQHFDRPQQQVPVEQWGGTVTLTGLGAGDRATVLAEFTEAHKCRAEGDAAGFGRRWSIIQAKLVVMSVTDEAGTRLFTEDDVPALLGKSPEVIGQLSDAILVMNKFSTKSVEDDAKN